MRIHIFNKAHRSKALKGLAVGVVLGVLSACLPHEVGNDHGSHVSVDLSKESLSARQLQDIADQIEAFLTDRFEQAQQKQGESNVACTEERRAFEHAYALQAFYKADECASYVAKCMESNVKNKGQWAYIGAKCAAASGDSDQAYRFYSQAVDKNKYASDVDFKARVLDFARFIEVSNYTLPGFESERLAKTALSIGFSSEGRDRFNTMLSLIRADIAGNSSVFEDSFSNKSFEEFVKAELTTAKGAYATYLRLLLYRVWSAGDSRSRDALLEMKAWIENPEVFKDLPYSKLHNIYLYSYGNLYVQNQTGLVGLSNHNIGLYTARQLYNAYLPFSSTRAPLPISRNTYTYEEMSRIERCENALSTDANLVRLNQIKAGWISAEISTDAAISQAKALDASPDKADVKTLLGYLYQLKGEQGKAFDYYTQAHEACPYYSRAHDGLQSLRSNGYYRGLKSYEETRTKFLSKVGNSIPSSLGQYIKNFKTMTNEQQRLLLASLDLWVPFLDFFVENDYGMYLKHGFEKISEIPGLERYGNGSRSDGDDQRLRDDIGGMAVDKLIVAGMMDLESIPFTSHNTPVHEVAHQFHYATSENIKTCITTLYNATKSRNLFSTGYAARNEYEYFAMGVQHYVIPEDAGSDMGINRSWYMNNDPRLFLLVDRIASTKGDRAKVAQINCPAASDETPLPKAKREIASAVLKGKDGTGQYLAVAIDTEVEEAYVCFDEEAVCRKDQTLAKPMKRDDFKGILSYFVYPDDLALSSGDKKTVTILGKEKGFAKFTYAKPVEIKVD